VSEDKSEPDVVIVVGASSGIGRAAAMRFAGRGDRLVLVSRSRQALAAAATACRARGCADVEIMVADVNDEPAMGAVVDATMRQWGRIDVVVHTATVMAYGTIEALPSDVFERVVDTAIHGTANVARAVLPVFRQQERGSLIIVSSLLASIAAPTMGAYTTAKWGQLGLIRTLQIETRDLPHVNISAVAPGGVNTPIYYQAANVTGKTGRPSPPAYSPDRVARAILARVDQPRRLVQAGLLNPVIIAGFRLFPQVFDALVGPLLGVFGVSSDRVAPTDGNVFQPRPDTEATEGRWRSI
jgi:NAD(P)-dependent dehydrogenase (short-subunit alcohol dehydrogenase family)